MAFLGFGSKNEAPKPPAPQAAAEPAAPPGQEAPQAGDPVIQEIQRLQQQGLTNSQIVQQLQRQGYKTYQIFDGFNTLDLMGKAGPGQAVPPDPELMGGPAPQGTPLVPPQGMSSGQEAPQDFGAPQDDGSGMDAPSMGGQGTGGDDRIEELVEAIIEEKWEELARNVNKIIAWKNAMESRIAVIEQRVTDLKSRADDTNRKVLEKMGTYDKSVQSVGAEVRTMEQIFQKVLPAFTENIHELERITRQMKQSSSRPAQAVRKERS